MMRLVLLAVPAMAAVDVTNDKITRSSNTVGKWAAPFTSDNQAVTYFSNGGTAIAPLVSGTEYFTHGAATVASNVASIQFSAAATDAAALDLTNAGDYKSAFYTKAAAATLHATVADAYVDSTKIWTTAAAHNLVDNDMVRIKQASAKPLTGLDSTKIYWVKKESNTTLKLKASKAATTFEGTTATLTADHVGTNAGFEKLTLVGYPTDQPAVSGVDPVNDKYTVNAHGLSNGDLLRHTCGGTDKDCAYPLTDGMFVKVSDKTANDFKITSVGIGADTADVTIDLQRTGDAAQAFKKCSAPKALTTTAVSSNAVESTAHGFADGDLVYWVGTAAGNLTIDAGSGAAAITSTVAYYITGKTANTFKLATSASGTAVTIANAPADTDRFCKLDATEIKPHKGAAAAGNATRAFGSALLFLVAFFA